MGKKIAIAALSILVLWLIGRGLRTAGEAQGQSTDIATPSVGEVATVRSLRPCGITRAALDEMVKWAVRGDSKEMFRTMRATGSFALADGMKVKVLDGGLAVVKVRVVEPVEDPRAGRECWTVKEAFQK